MIKITVMSILTVKAHGNIALYTQREKTKHEGEN